jgi:hypothetical protein
LRVKNVLHRVGWKCKRFSSSLLTPIPTLGEERRGEERKGKERRGEERKGWRNG